MIIESFNEEETFLLGEKIGKEAESGSVFALLGDLGVGKTVFTQGVAKGLEIEDSICSPTFTIVQVYEADFRFITLMYIALVILKRWTKLDMKIIFMVMGFVS